MAVARPLRGAPPRLIASAVMIGTLALSGCQAGTGGAVPEEGSSSPTGGETPTQAAPPEAQGEDAVIDDGAAAAGVDLTDLGEPVASAEVPAVVDGDPAATMTVALYGLRREEGTVVATYSFTVHSDVSDTEEWIYSYLGGQGWHPYAIDTVNLNKHDVLGNGQAQTAYQGMKFRPGQTLYAYAVFAAPPAEVTAMDVMLVDSAPLASGVEIR